MAQRRLALPEVSSCQLYENCDGNVHTIQSDPSFSISVVDLARQVSAVIFPTAFFFVSDIGPPIQMFIRQWAVLQARAMFSLDVSSPKRWRDLVLIALANSPSASVVSLGLAVTDNNELSAIDFRLVTMVAVSERILDSASIADDIEVFIRMLWQTWSLLIDSDRTVHPAIV